MTFAIKRNDRLPAFASTLEAPPGTAVDLTGATAKFIMTPVDSTTPTINTGATVVSASAGRVQYSWGATDTATAGVYKAEWEVTFAGGLKRTFPSEDYLYIHIVTDLA